MLEQSDAFVASGEGISISRGREPFSNTPDSIKMAMMEHDTNNRTRYAPSSGIPELQNRSC